MPFSAGRPETLCGAGSMVANTTSIRAWLPGLLQVLEVKTLLDAPCGDFNWMAHTDLSKIDYIGGDYDREHIDRALSRVSDPVCYTPRLKTLVHIDLVSDEFPPADLMLCREFLQHLPNVLVVRVLQNFLASGIPWLLATSHHNAVNADIADAGMFRPLNLSVAPFSWPAPCHAMGDQPGSGRILGLWHRSHIAQGN